MVLRDLNSRLAQGVRWAGIVLSVAVLISVANGQDRKVVLGLCSVATGPSNNRVISVRGAGGFSLNGDGFLLVDRTCGLSGELPESGERWGEVLLRVDSRTMKGPPLAAFKAASTVLPSGVFQVLVQGEITCRRVARRADEVRGRAFGSWGLIPCVLWVRSISEFHKVR